MTTWDTVCLVTGSFSVVYLVVRIREKGSDWRATMGFALAMNIDMILDVLHRNLK